ncbi:hypothetical protein GCM10011506_27120 [Marivirga lumbricoides]|uniref:Uncharacterized protein n=1 Tax=Marivirga lumbricoides TaxID=1046115 RepID=A0ABQ1MND7_9BACT|nr:hypothetical protein GCM10011506_27120 [Marivirga lumbricoides]
MKFSLPLLFCLLCFYNSFSQLKLSDTTQFSLIYKDKVNPDIEIERYDFFGDFFIRQSKGEAIKKLFGEEVIQIDDLSTEVLYNYFVISEKLEITNPEQAEWARDILQRGDTVINSSELLHFTVFESRRNSSITTELFYLKKVTLPKKFRNISSIYRGKNSLFRPESHQILYKITSVSSDGSKLSEMELMEINDSEFDEEKIQQLVSSHN